jgi:hypothetical protein
MLVLGPHDVILQSGSSPVVEDDRVLARTDPRRTQGPLIRGLLDALSEARRDELVAASPIADELVVAVAPDVTMGTIIDVIYTAGRADFGAYQFVVETPDGARGLNVVPPRLCDGPVESTQVCVHPQVFVASDGVFASARLVDRESSCTTPAADEAAFTGRVIAGPTGRCPTTLPDDVTGLANTLDGIAQLGDPCIYAVFGGENDVPWARLAPLAAWLQAKRELALVIEAGAGSTDCTQTFTLPEATG